MHGITTPTASTFARLVGLIQSGQLKPLLEATYKLQDLPEAQTQMIKRAHVGKIVVTP
jgi:NADPH:quinone reductase-like Zn-dependent oxidoreductase